MSDIRLERSIPYAIKKNPLAIIGYADITFTDARHGGQILVWEAKAEGYGAAQAYNETMHYCAFLTLAGHKAVAGFPLIGYAPYPTKGGMVFAYSPGNQKGGILYYVVPDQTAQPRQPDPQPGPAPVLAPDASIAAEFGILAAVGGGLLWLARQLAPVVTDCGEGGCS